MAWEYRDLFDMPMKPAAEPADLVEMIEEKTESSIRVGQMGYRTRTTIAGPRLEAEVYPIFGRSKMGMLRAARTHETKASQQAANIRRAKEHLIRVVDANFDERDYHLTLTYAQEPESVERCEKDVANFLGRVKRAWKKQGIRKATGRELKYLYTIGHDKDERIHVHMLITGGLSREEYEAIWKKGKQGQGVTNCLQLQPDEKGLQGIANYVYRQNERARIAGERKQEKSWRGSKNLKRKFKVRESDSKCSNHRVKTIAYGIQNEAKENMEKLYPGYRFVECRVSYSNLIDGVYIRCVMRKREVKR